MPKYEYAEIKKEEEIIEHEKILFDAFINRAPDEWMVNHYERIDNCRLKPPYPYSDLIILGVKKDNTLLATCLINLNNKNKMQLEELGFSRSSIDVNSNFAEGLAFCTNGNRFTIDDFAIMEDVMSFFKKEFKKHNLQKIYATCNERLKIFYFKLGFQIIDKKDKELLLELIV